VSVVVEAEVETLVQGVVVVVVEEEIIVHEVLAEEEEEEETIALVAATPFTIDEALHLLPWVVVTTTWVAVVVEAAFRQIDVTMQWVAEWVE